MVVCVVCVKHFLENPSSETKADKKEESEGEWLCGECSTKCHRRKRVKRRSSFEQDYKIGGVFDMNASPPSEADGDDVANTVMMKMELDVKRQDTHDNPFVGVAVTSPNTRSDMQTAQLNLDIATQNASLVYLQALKDYISKRRGVIEDGWHVKFEYSESMCKTSPIYCSPDGSRFDSMPKVAHHLGLLSASNSSDTNDNVGSFALPQNGSYANGGNVSKVDPMENGYRGSESSLGSLPVQFQDFIVISVGKINPRPPFYNTSQIWPIGYKSIWHDKLTGSIFTLNILDSGDRGPIFRVHRKPCTKHSIPNASTVIYKLCGPSDEISSCVFPPQESQQLTNDNFINGDTIGEFLVEGRTPSSAWQMVIETFIRACRQAFQDMKLLTFCCNHRAESQYFYTSYSNDSLNKFGGLNCPINNIPRFVQTIDQLEVACNVLRKWLQVDRFGLDAEFVQELIELLPGVAACSEYISLDTRCQNKISHTVRSGFFTGLRKYNSQPTVSDSPVETDTRISPPGNEIASNLPRGLVGNVLQAYEFSLRFYNILGQEAPLSRQKLEYELLNPRVDDLNSTNDDNNGCRSPLSNFHMAMLKMLVEDMLAKVSINYPSGAMESKPRKGRKKNIDVIVSGQTIKIGIFPVNEITWPELARRYILVLKSMDDNLDYLDISSHEYEKVFHCLNGNGGPLCGNLRGMAAIKADAVAIAEASKKIFSSVKSKIVDVVIDLKDLDIDESAIETKRIDDKPEWIDRLEPIQNLATNVGAKIRNRIRDSLNKGPPGWAAEMLRESISKDVYKGNAAGPTKSDWRALHGVLVGCLALMRRKSDIGAISSSDATAVAQSFMENLQVQSYGQQDRKLCFEILECLLDSYFDAALTLKDEFIYVICEAIDAEKDPQCLLITFHLVELVALKYPESSDELTSYAEDLFNILGSYFPIHFTHPKGEDDVKREELSKALMLAFASTPLFEPFSIPLLLEKLSSSLPSAKIESLKYLSHCTAKYGAQRMLKHHEALWSSLKDAVFTSATPSLAVGPEHQDNKIVDEALILLQKLIQQDNASFLNLILKDAEISTTLKTLSNHKSSDVIAEPDKQRLNAVGQILYVSAAASAASCNAVFQSFFSGLVNGLGSMTLDEKPHFGYLYICVELLAACRTLVVGHSSTTYPDSETWCGILHSICSSLASSLVKSMKESTKDVDSHYSVKGLQILASFPGDFMPVSKSTFENILAEFISVISLNFDNTSLWRSVLNALAEIGSYIEEYHDSEKTPSFDVIVLESMVVLLSSEDSAMPLSLKVEAVSEIGKTNLKYMLKIVQELNKAICTSLHEYWLDGNSKSAERAMLLLECYAVKVLPWFDNIEVTNDVPMHFALKIWDEIQVSTLFSDSLKEKKLLETTMNAMKHAVANCSEVSQSLILDKAFNILSSSTSFQLDEPMQPAEYSCRDEWIISLFDSVIIALHPKAHLNNTNQILQILMRALQNGHVPSAHALGSLLNKMPVKDNKLGADSDAQYCSLEEAIDITINRYISDDNNEIGVSNLKSSNVNDGLEHVSVHGIVGLAWMGKGLLMRGHEKVKDVIKFLLNCLISNESIDSSADCQDLMRAAADSFSVIMSDSEACLNKRLHATIRPLYKQRLFNMVMPILRSSVVKSDSPITRSMLHRALAHVIINTPLSAIMGEANKLIPLLIDGLTILSEDVQNRDIVYNLLLVLSGILTDKNGQEAIVENAYIIIRCLNKLVFYQHMMLVRETAIQCLTAMSELPYATIYRFSTEVLQALSRALDDPKRSVRQEAVKCRHAWTKISS